MIKFPLFAILLFIGTAVFAQTQTEKEVKGLLAHKWKLTHMEQGGQKTPIPTEFGDSFLDIKPDGTIIMTDPHEQEKGKWSYDHVTKMVTATAEDEAQKFEVIKVTDTELVMKVTDEGITMTMYLKRVADPGK